MFSVRPLEIWFGAHSERVRLLSEAFFLYLSDVFSSVSDDLFIVGHGYFHVSQCV